MKRELLVNLGGDDYQAVNIWEKTTAGDVLKQVLSAAVGDSLITLEGVTVMIVMLCNTVITNNIIAILNSCHHINLYMEKANTSS